MPEPVNSCPACSSKKIEVFHTYVDVERPSQTFWFCNGCHLIFANPRPTEEELAKFYREGYRTMTSGQEVPTQQQVKDETFRAFRIANMVMRHTKKVEHHLDIGSSSGALLAAMSDRFATSMPVGVEPSDGYRKMSLEQFAKVGERVKDDRPNVQHAKVFATLDEVEEKFDLITIIHTLEHLTEPREFLCLVVRDYLSPDGLLVVETPRLGGGHISPLMFPHLHVFMESSLRRLLQRVGMEVVSEETPNFVAGPTFPSPKDIIMVAVRSAAIKDWKTYWMERMNMATEDMLRVKDEMKRLQDYQVG